MTIEMLALCLGLNGQFDQQVPFDQFAVTKFHADVIKRNGRDRVDRAYIGAAKRVSVMDVDASKAALKECERDFATLLFVD